MKKLLSTFSILALFFPFCEKVIADDYKFFKTSTSIISNTPTVKFYGVSSSGTETLLKTWESTTSDVTGISADLGGYAMTDEYEGKIYIEVNESTIGGGGVTATVLEYDLINNSVEKVNNVSEIEEITIYPQGITQMIKKDSSTGVTSIGENSLKLKETTTEQQLWGTNADGKVVPINITNGSKLLINGRDVEQSINNVGALSAALTGLPTVPTDTTLACGLGTGTHGGDFAFSGGCASKINEKLSVNYAASMTMPGQDYAGDFEDTFSARAGFVWKLGKAIKPTQITMKEGKELKEEIITLKENNQNIISQNKALLARLEKLEKLALVENKSKDLAIYKLK